MVSTISSWRGVEGDDPRVLRRAQILTVAVGVIAVGFGSRGGSVLYLFLLANLICSAFAFPLLYGLFNRKIGGGQALAAGGAGIVTGGLFFPRPDFSSWSGLPADMFISFLTALVLSAVLAVLFGLTGRTDG